MTPRARSTHLGLRRFALYGSDIGAATAITYT